MVDTVIVLYDSNEVFKPETERFKTLGIGILPDVVSCTITEEINGIYELDMEYPINGELSEQITTRKILFVKPNKYTGKQAFRISSIEKSTDGNMQIHAGHITYDMANYIYCPTRDGSHAIELAGAIADIHRHSRSDWGDNPRSELMPCKIYMGPPSAKDYIDRYSETQWDYLGSAEYESESWRPNMLAQLADAGGLIDSGYVEFQNPLSFRQMMFTDDPYSLLNVYDFEYIYDNTNIFMTKKRGTEKDLLISYGYNMESLSYTEDTSAIFSHVRPYLTRIESDPSTGQTKGYNVLGDHISLSGYVPAGTIPVDHVNVYPLCVDDIDAELRTTLKRSYENVDIQQMKNDGVNLKAQIEADAKKWLMNDEGKHAKELCMPYISVECSFKSLKEYNDPISRSISNAMDRLELGDRVILLNKDLNFMSNTRLMKITYDVLTGEYTDVEFSSCQNKLDNTVASYKQEITRLKRESTIKRHLQR